MDSEIKRIDRILKKFDRDLFSRRGPDGKIRVIQKVKSLKSFDLGKFKIAVPTIQEHLAFMMTDNWSASGRQVSWGHEPISEKLRHIALTRREELIREVEESQKKAEEKRERDQVSKFEDIAYETRDVYKKAFSDVLTHSMDRTKDPRRKQERGI